MVGLLVSAHLRITRESDSWRVHFNINIDVNILSPMETARRGAPRNGNRPRQADAAKIVHGLRRIVRALHSYSQDVYRAYGLTAPQLWALKTLQMEGPLPAGRLADALVVHQSSLSVLIGRLEKRQLVHRIRTPQDRRYVRIALTKRGVALASRAPEPAQGRLLHGLREMTRSEVRSIRRGVDRLVEAMEAGGAKVQFFFSES
jgi:MarR family transcriptional regulator, organic hydroperoxide resistance regulator